MAVAWADFLASIIPGSLLRACKGSILFTYIAETLAGSQQRKSFATLLCGFRQPLFVPHVGREAPGGLHSSLTGPKEAAASTA